MRADRVKSQFANGNPHAICAQITKAKDAFAVGDHNHPHMFGRPVAQHFRNSAGVSD